MSEIKKILAVIKKNRILFLLGACGLILLLVGGRFGKKEAEQTNFSATRNYEEYRMSLEATLEEDCARIRGVGSASVTLTLASSEIAVYEKNQSGTGESVAVAGGEALLLAYRVPEITGVAVICSGGADPIVQKELYDFFGAVLGLDTTQIHVAPSA